MRPISRLRVDQNRIGVRGQIRIGEYKWGPIHTSKENAIKGIPSHDIGAAKDVIEDAIKDGFLNLKPTSYGDQISLNFKRKEEIKAILEIYSYL